MIHALPGMGADHRMFPGEWKSLPNFRAHDWVRYSGETSLAEMAGSMCEATGIRDGDILLGASLGGMVGCEITKIRKIPILILVGSAISKSDVSSLLAILHPLARFAPIDWLRMSSGKIPSELAQMFSGAESSFIRAMCEAVFRWDGLGETDAKVIRLHGKFDRVIPPPRKADLLLDGGHLISMTHAKQCVEFIQECKMIE